MAFSDSMAMPISRVRRSRGAVSSILLLACVGCSFPGREETRRHGRQEIFGHSHEGKAIRATILGDGPDTYLLLGVIHGNEPLGAPLLERFIERIEVDPELMTRKRLVVVPVVNPDGLAKKSRTNARGIDLNRNFPAKNWRPSPRHGKYPGSEPETRAVLKIMRQFRPTRILAIHSPLRCVNFDGPAADIARRMAAVTPYPLRPTIGYPTPGSLGNYAGNDLRTPTITLELAKNATVEQAWQDTYRALEAFVRDAARSAGGYSARGHRYSGAERREAGGAGN